MKRWLMSMAVVWFLMGCQTVQQGAINVQQPTGGSLLKHDRTLRFKNNTVILKINPPAHISGPGTKLVVAPQDIELKEFLKIVNFSPDDIPNDLKANLKRGLGMSEYSFDLFTPVLLTKEVRLKIVNFMGAHELEITFHKGSRMPTIIRAFNED